jgi:hypothetical protein
MKIVCSVRFIGDVLLVAEAGDVEICTYTIRKIATCYVSNVTEQLHKMYRETVRLCLTSVMYFVVSA